MYSSLSNFIYFICSCIVFIVRNKMKQSSFVIVEYLTALVSFPFIERLLFPFRKSRYFYCFCMILSLCMNSSRLIVNRYIFIYHDIFFLFCYFVLLISCQLTVIPRICYVICRIRKGNVNSKRSTLFRGKSESAWRFLGKKNVGAGPNFNFSIAAGP